MAEPCRELDHFAADVLARSVPAQHCAYREGVPKIVDARTTTVPKKELRFSQSDLLADMREVVACTAIAETAPLTGHEECLRLAAQQSVPLATVAFQPMHDTRVQRQQPFLAELALPDAKHAGFYIKVGRVKSKSFADPKPGYGDQAEQRRAGRPRRP